MAGTEKRDISLRGAAFLNLGIVGLLLLASVVVHLLFAHLRARESRSQGAPVSLVRGEARPLPPEPRLQRAPAQDARAQRELDELALDAYGWVDRRAGRVRIPIARAIDLLAERGLPARSRP